MNDIEGQMNLFDILNQEHIISEPPILLSAGQELYVVVKGDVRKACVHNERSWLCGDNDRGYRLKYENGTYDCAWNSVIGKEVFFIKNDAVRKAEEYLDTHEVIRAEDIKPLRTVAYQYIRETDKRLMTAFYSELDNGMLYVKEFVTFHYMVEADKKEKVIKKFMEQQTLECEDIKEAEYEPVFKNMYRIRQKYDWDYAEAGHMMATG